MKILDVNDFDENIKTGISVIDFYADWCGPCNALSPILKEIASKYEPKIKFFKLDIDKDSDIAKRFDVMSIPTVLFFKDGILINSITGLQPEQNYIKQIETLK